MGEFWDLTPRELQAAFDAAVWRQDQEWKRTRWMAWTVAALGRVKTLPPLGRFLGAAAGPKVDKAELERRKAEHEEMVRRMTHGG